MLRLPDNVECLSDVLMGLATYGGARVPIEWQEWLLSVGVAVRTDGGSWMFPTDAFLRDALPAQDALDLLRRVAVRDPMYRFHLDLSLLSVIHAVASAERWRRLEELLFDSCRAIAPRLIQLLEWEMARAGRGARQLTDSDWTVAHESIVKEMGTVFFKWDSRLWGACRGTAELFPLLLSLYLPMCHLPIHVVGGESNDPTSSELCLATLVKASGDGEGVEFTRDRMAGIRRLQDLGIPVRVRDSDSSHFIASLVSPTTLQSSLTVTLADYSPAPANMAAAARSSYSLHQVEERLPSRLSTLEEGKTTIALCSMPTECLRWPAERCVASPHWLPLPGASEFAAAGKRRNESESVDQALCDLAEHPLYGLVLHLLILEALDRELGEETVILSPPLNRKIESVEHWAETIVLYRPREEPSTDLSLPTKRCLVLGQFDEVFGRVAREIGVVRVASTLRTGSATPWSRALALMSTADLVVGTHDRWTITAHVLDRLHAGVLMKDIIRQGRALREKMHSIFLSLWQEKSCAGSKEAVTI